MLIKAYLTVSWKVLFMSIILRNSNRAREKGVIFDVGHGQGSFDWCVAENACSEHSKFWPDVISTDLHTGNVNGPVRDLVNSSVY